MKLIAEFLKSTVVGGLLVIMPLGLMAMVAAKALLLIAPAAETVSGRLPELFRFPLLTGILLLVFVCFAAGLLAQTASAQRAGTFLEGSVLIRIPGYSMLRSLTNRIGNIEDSDRFASAFVTIEDSLVPAFVIETHEDGRYTVFVPSAPTPAVGTIYVMNPDRVHLVDAKFMDTISCVSSFGTGAEALVKRIRPR